MQSSVLRVLVCVHNWSLRDGLIHLIKSQPEFQIESTAHSCEEALLITDSCKPDVIVLDLDLPGHAEGSLVLLLRSRLPSAKIVVLSNYSGDIETLKALNEGATAYISKNSLRLNMIPLLRTFML